MTEMKATVELKDTAVEGAANGGGSILLVDDEGAIRRLFQLILAAALPDCRIDVAADGAEAVRCFTEGRHRVLVMDLHMPVMDGQTAFCKIQELCESGSLEMPAVVFCTGFAPPDVVTRVVEGSGKHCLLSKPVSGDVLTEAVRSRL
ncbi:response regulator [Verrucomicrobiota bacterium]